MIRNQQDPDTNNFTKSPIISGLNAKMKVLRKNKTDSTVRQPGVAISTINTSVPRPEFFTTRRKVSRRNVAVVAQNNTKPSLVQKPTRSLPGTTKNNTESGKLIENVQGRQYVGDVHFNGVTSMAGVDVTVEKENVISTPEHITRSCEYESKVSLDVLIKRMKAAKSRGVKRARIGAVKYLGRAVELLLKNLLTKISAAASHRMTKLK